MVGKALFDGTAWTLQPVVQLGVMLPPPSGATSAIQFVMRPGADSSAIADRIAGPGAYVQPAPFSGMNPPPNVAERLLRTYLVPVAPGTEQQALGRASNDPDVESARLVGWPPVIPM